VVTFETSVAVKQIDSELGGPLGQFFTSISEEPVAAASLAQVYLATLNDGKDTRVADAFTKRLSEMVRDYLFGNWTY
jgi:predicted unusual protein kinase regulating ubiquinone biosynthesis (AarF/ABC1/UbiB family)